MTTVTVSLSLPAILDAIEQLSPAQRRQLQRRLYASGLFVPEPLLTDQQRLQVAPALGEAVTKRRNQSPRPGASGLMPTEIPIRTAPAPAKTPATPKADYRSPVSGKVVVGTPEKSAAPPDPHQMLPLPGQAPEQPIGIVFDGGSRGNPGQGYGSYVLRWPGEQQQIVRLRFGNRVTNNEAEYDTLLAALDAVLKRLRDGGADPKTARLEVRGDSLLVINQVKGDWQCKDSRMAARRDQVRGLLQQLGGWQLIHHDRSHSVEQLGH